MNSRSGSIAHRALHYCTSPSQNPSPRCLCKLKSYNSLDKPWKPTMRTAAALFPDVLSPAISPIWSAIKLGSDWNPAHCDTVKPYLGSNQTSLSTEFIRHVFLTGGARRPGGDCTRRIPWPRQGANLLGFCSINQWLCQLSFQARLTSILETACKPMQVSPCTCASRPWQGSFGKFAPPCRRGKGSL